MGSYDDPYPHWLASGEPPAIHLWAEHFLRCAKKRNPLYTKYLNERLALTKVKYVFLNSDQVFGKTLDELKIPACGTKISSSFLNKYKTYNKKQNRSRKRSEFSKISNLRNYSLFEDTEQSLYVNNYSYLEFSEDTSQTGMDSENDVYDDISEIFQKFNSEPFRSLPRSTRPSDYQYTHKLSKKGILERKDNEFSNKFKGFQDHSNYNSELFVQRGRTYKRMLKNSSNGRNTGKYTQIEKAPSKIHKLNSFEDSVPEFSSSSAESLLSTRSSLNDSSIMSFSPVVSDIENQQQPISTEDELKKCNNFTTQQHSSNKLTLDPVSQVRIQDIYEKQTRLSDKENKLSQKRRKVEEISVSTDVSQNNSTGQSIEKSQNIAQMSKNLRTNAVIIAASFKDGSTLSNSTDDISKQSIIDVIDPKPNQICIQNQIKPFITDVEPEEIDQDVWQSSSQSQKMLIEDNFQENYYINDLKTSRMENSENKKLINKREDMITEKIDTSLGIHSRSNIAIKSNVVTEEDLFSPNCLDDDKGHRIKRCVQRRCCTRIFEDSPFTRVFCKNSDLLTPKYEERKVQMGDKAPVEEEIDKENSKEHGKQKMKYYNRVRIPKRDTYKALEGRHLNVGKSFDKENRQTNKLEGGGKRSPPQNLQIEISNRNKISRLKSLRVPLIDIKEIVQGDKGHIPFVQTPQNLLVNPKLIASKDVSRI